MSHTENQEARLLDAFASLNEQQRSTLLSFAEFLRTQPVPGETASAVAAPATTQPVEPTPIPRPEQETVVGAIKRLSVSFHMLDKSNMLHETSALMAQHMLQGREATEVIDELEQVFERYYRRHLERNS